MHAYEYTLICVNWTEWRKEREVGGDGVCGCSFGEPLKQETFHVTENRIFMLCRMITWVVFLWMFLNFISSLPVKRGGSLSFLVGTISNVLVMEIGWRDVGSGGYILLSCAHSNTSCIRLDSTNIITSITDCCIRLDSTNIITSITDSCVRLDSH